MVFVLHPHTGQYKNPRSSTRTIASLSLGGTGRTRTCTPESTGERISNPPQYLLCLLFRVSCAGNGIDARFFGTQYAVGYVHSNPRRNCRMISHAGSKPLRYPAAFFVFARGRFKRPSVWEGGPEIEKAKLVIYRAMKRGRGSLHGLLRNFFYTSITHSKRKVFRFFSGFQIFLNF